MNYQCENPHGSGCNLLPNRDGTGFACSWGCGKRVTRVDGKWVVSRDAAPSSAGRDE